MFVEEEMRMDEKSGDCLCLRSRGNVCGMDARESGLVIQEKTQKMACPWRLML